ncbi:aquaporin-11 [Latimeria chalumnae]|uniref:Aquaporin n=1 Tax=Latimeria chalumnae TaxID=7897 RepID=M3XLI8_LATCH|nr:PREDICTED: aquaporin-11 [Latimeria chalumnae]|eukprot:XP_006006366.1 PREDICTED: aquaporin-11 [Latimeria chalumnae]
MADLKISLVILVLTVLICEGGRRTAKRFLSGRVYCSFLVELVSTFQLCACTQELRLLGEDGRLEPKVGLTLTYVITVVHALTFDGAVCNPSGALEQLYRKHASCKGVTLKIVCHFLAAVGAKLYAVHTWSLGMSDLHLRHKLTGYACVSGIHTTLLKGATVELACAFTLQTTLIKLHNWETKYKVHLIAAVITFLVYAGGSLTGAVFNPALAYSLHFHCKGNTFLQYAFVYWVGPIVGLISSVILFDKIVPLLFPQNFTTTHKKKRK